MKQKGYTNNAGYVIDDKKVYIEAKKDISACSEIFVDYSKDYWDVTKKNIRWIEKGENKNTRSKQKTKA